MRGIALALLLLAASPLSAAELVITVDGIRSDRGDIRVSVYASAAEWPDKSARANDQVKKAQQGSVVFRYQLPPGIYAANGYHDENGNGKFDTSLIGLPEEGYMFSNNVSPFLSAPSFDSASFKLPREGAAISMRVQY
ncbi:MAG TPA: DUF2141 domain-containing protein [Stellaceae bacterium]|nr:DUF2141 domain-containing protein [Stellaceae bacterium]